MSSYRRYATHRMSVERAQRQIQRHQQESYAEPFPDGSMYFGQFAERFAAMPIAAPDEPYRDCLTHIAGSCVGNTRDCVRAPGRTT